MSSRGGEPPLLALTSTKATGPLFTEAGGAPESERGESRGRAANVGLVRAVSWRLAALLRALRLPLSAPSLTPSLTLDDAGPWTLDPGPRTPDPGPWSLSLDDDSHRH